MTFTNNPWQVWNMMSYQTALLGCLLQLVYALFTIFFNKNVHNHTALH